MKKLTKIAFVVAFAAIAGYGVYTSQQSNSMYDLLLANVEALAFDAEADSVTCEKDDGDTCVVGSVSVSNYDEKNNPWY